MKLLLLGFICLAFNSIGQKDSPISFDVLNDTIYFTYIDLKDPLDTFVYEKTLGEDTSIDYILDLEIKNSSEKNYLLYFDSNMVWVHHFGPLPLTDTIRYDHGCNLITLLYDKDGNRKDAGGGFVYWADDYTPDYISEEIKINEYYETKKIKISKDKRYENYSLNKNKLYLNAGEKKKLKVAMKIPYYHLSFHNYFILDKSEIYYIDFYFHNKCQKIKEALTKSELKELKKNNIHIYGGTIHTDKKIVLMYKENLK